MAFDQDATLIRMASPRISLYNLGSTQSTTHHTPPSRGGGVNQICPTGSARGRCLGRRCPYLLPGRLGDKSNRKKHPLHRVMSEVQRRYIGDEGTPPAKQHV
jgi:hypothetical protein